MRCNSSIIWRLCTKLDYDTQRSKGKSSTKPMVFRSCIPVLRKQNCGLLGQNKRRSKETSHNFQREPSGPEM
ncbi:hypothetical protein EUGRSUZ_H02193 [Eucalyptus grandis]|uniref:Uncharacterized protein n=2 Tax=Eucalyptus grandis TaxID=71139 RepID=A0ACC3JRW7_EUCGR|nr:hypothetical protein EUGRSUZ_H02193 [Eucalyptus grandis]